MQRTTPLFPVRRAVLADRADRYEPHLQPTMRPEILLEKWRTDTGTQEQLRQNVLAVLTDIFERGEEVPVVVSWGCGGWTGRLW